MPTEKQWMYPIKGMHEYKGILCMPDSTTEIFDWIDNELEFEDGDVLLCAYPCSGDIWLQEVVWYLHNLNKLSSKNPSIGIRVPHIDHEFHGHKQPKDFFKAIQAPRVFKSRMPADRLQRHLDGKVKVIYWVMDPRDTLLKYQHLYNTLGAKFQQFPHIEFDDYFKLFQQKQLFEGDWFDTTLSYLPYADKNNIMLLKYEDEAKDPENTVKKLADFFNITITEEQLTKLVNVVPFDAVTDWRSRFSPEQLDWYTAKYQEKMKGTVLEKTY